MNKKLALTMVLLISCPLLGVADDLSAQQSDPSIRARMGEIRDQTLFEKRVDEASEVYHAITKGPHGEVPKSVLQNTRCIAILPNVLTGAFVVGGTHGEGLASCKSSNNEWSQPAAISLYQGSIGLQAGAKSADLVLFFQTDKAEKALKRGKFALGSDVSAVAGTFNSNVETSNAGVVVYTRSQGLFAGASVNGSKISKYQDELDRYYGKDVEYLALLEGRESPDTTGYSKKLITLFP